MVRKIKSGQISAGLSVRVCSCLSSRAFFLVQGSPQSLQRAYTAAQELLEASP